jgi:glycosyltransferase involved in cell wall biosynthesis
MNIAYITSEFVTEKAHGGLATYLNNISTIMSEHGHNITIITLSDCNGRIDYKHGIEVVRVKTKEIQGSNNEIKRGIVLLSNSLKLYKALKKVNRCKKIDIVQAANYKAVGFFRSFRIPTIVRVSSDSSLLRNAGKFEFDFKGALKEKTFTDYLELCCVKLADAAFAPSRFCANVTKKRSGREVTIIESPYINCSKQMDESIYQNKLNQKKYLLFNSSLSTLKGTHVAIGATDYLLENHKDLYLVYAGYDYGMTLKGGNHKSIAEILEMQRRKYNGRVIYLGNINQEQLFPIIRHSLACVLPSRVDNLPNSCIEAMSLGGIVIGTYGASFEQLIRNKENGLLIKRDSSKALCCAVDYLMDMDEETYQGMQIRAAEAIDRLAPEKVYLNTIQCYKKAINEFKGFKYGKRY